MEALRDVSLPSFGQRYTSLQTLLGCPSNRTVSYNKRDCSMSSNLGPKSSVPHISEKTS